MRHWFLSYNSQDLPLMEGLAAALERKDARCRTFFAPKSLRAGGYWLPKLAEAIAESTAFVLLVGERGLGPWQILEYYEALDRRVKEPGYPVVLILLAGQTAPGLPFLRQLHWIVTPDAASDETIGKLIHAASDPTSVPVELWRFTAPYRGLAAMTESDSDFFFGRDRKIVEALNAFDSTTGRLPVLLGNSGVGKSSLAQAGILAALARQGWPDNVKDTGPWPRSLRDSRRWCFVKLRPGSEPLKALVEPFLRTWRFETTDPQWATRRADWVQALDEGKLGLGDLIDATERRHEELQQPRPPAFFLYVDQGEELYVRAGERQQRRFSEIVGKGLGDPRLRILMSLRSDFFGALQRDEALFNVHHQINVPPLREPELLEIISRPAQLLSARFETDHLAADMAHRAAADSAKDVGALPLLSYLLDDMWTKMVERGDGLLRLPPGALELGRVLVERANAFLEDRPDSEGRLRRIFTLMLATVREDGEPTRRRALRSEFSEDEWKLVAELADHPNRLLVIATPEGSETYAEVAHEAIFRRWSKLREWIVAEREFLAWRSGLEISRRTWQAAPDAKKRDALLMGLALTQAQSWLARRAADISTSDRAFIVLSGKAARQRRRRVQALVAALALLIVAALLARLNERYLRDSWRWFAVVRPYMTTQVRPHVLTADAERALKPKQTFRECAGNCPEMVVVPAGSFLMGSAADEAGRFPSEDPRHEVVFARPFAVSRFAVTFDEWDECVAYGDCDARVSDSTFGRGRRPVINVNWQDAQRYVAWLSRMTGKPYRLLSEAEFEYAARAGSQTVYPWGDEIGANNANCNGCGTSWDGRQTAPVGSFAPNGFGLYDMVGNVWQWVEDCFVESYDQAPANGAARTASDCSRRATRGGSWSSTPRVLRSANRGRNTPVVRYVDLGFRVGRTLAP